MEHFSDYVQGVMHALLLGAVGVVIGIGNLLDAGRLPAFRRVLGRAIVSGGLGMASGAVLIWFPELPLVGQLGAAAMISSLGVSGIEALYFRHFHKDVDRRAGN